MTWPDYLTICGCEVESSGCETESSAVVAIATMLLIYYAR